MVSLPAIIERLTPRAPSRHVALTPAGDRAVSWGRDGLTALDEHGALHSWTTEDVAYAAPFGDALWTVALRDGAWWIAGHAWSDAGAAGPPPARLPALGDHIHGAHTAAGAPVLLLHGAVTCELRRERDAWVIQELPTSADRPVLLGARYWLERRGSQLVVRRGGQTQLLDVPADAVAGGTIAGGCAIAGGSLAVIDFACRTGRRLLVIDVRTGSVHRLLRLDDAHGVTLAAQPGHALISRGEDRLTIIDLLHNRCIADQAFGRAAAIAISASGLHVAIADGDRLRRMRYAELLAASPPAVIAADPAALPGDVPVPSRPAEPSDSPHRASRRALASAPVEVEPHEPALDVDPEPELPERSPPCAVNEAVNDAWLNAPLCALVPRPPAPGLGGDELDAYLADAFGLVAAMCGRAIAKSWDSGRLGGTSALPYANEIAAILDGCTGRASERLAAAREREQLAWARFGRWNRSGAPHVELADDMALSPLATASLLVVAAPSLWGELARVYGVLCNDLARPMCDELLVAQILGANAAARRELARELDDDAPLIRHGLITRSAARRPFCELTAPDVAIARLAGDPRAVLHRVGDAVARPADRALGELRCGGDPLARLVEALSAPRPEGAPLRLALRGRPGTGRRTLAAALAARAGRRLAAIELTGPADALVDRLRRALRDAHVLGWLPCVSGLDAVDEPAAVAAVAAIRSALARHPGPVILRLAAGATPPLEPGYLVHELAPPAPAARAAAWQATLADHGLSAAPARSLAERYDVGAGAMTRAVAQVAAEPRGAELEPLIDRALRQQLAGRIGAVARRVDRLASWDDLVLPDEVRAGARAFCDRVRHRGRVLDDWGMGRIASTGRGLTALFQGGPGTGKTMMAGAIARELGYELYRIDLSKILSKWIGETEKNLGTVFDAAEDGEMVLLFDEADALFARRTEVKTSNDRHANAEVNYLLQRLDSFEGVAILTTNFGTSIDDAFKRRLSCRLTVPFPDEELRAALWRVHLPPTLVGDTGPALAERAARHEMSGGYIRNAALRAAYLAAGLHGRITAELLDEAVRTEYREADRLGQTGPLQ